MDFAHCWWEGEDGLILGPRASPSLERLTGILAHSPRKISKGFLRSVSSVLDKSALRFLRRSCDLSIRRKFREWRTSGQCQGLDCGLSGNGGIDGIWKALSRPQRRSGCLRRPVAQNCSSRESQIFAPSLLATHSPRPHVRPQEVTPRVRKSALFSCLTAFASADF